MALLNINENVIGANKGTYVKQDANADAYILAEGITDPVLKSAITKLVIDLKAINAVHPNFVNFDDISLSNRKAIYPFPGTGAVNTRNLMNPANSNAAKRLVFSAAPTITVKGVNFGGNKFATSNILANEFDINDVEIGAVLTDEGTQLPNETEMGCYNGSGSLMLICNVSYAFNTFIGTSANSKGAAGSTFFTNSMRKGPNAGDIVIKKDFYSKAITTTPAGTLPAMDIQIGSLNGLARFSNRTFGFVGIGKSFSDTVYSLYYSAIAKYNHALGRMPLKNILFEGHSFMALGPVPAQIVANTSLSGYSTCGFANIATGGDKISNLVDRVATFDSYKKTITGVPIKNICCLWIGTNETITNGDTIYQNLVNFLTSQIAKDWTFIVATMTPRNNSPAWRIVFNDHIRANTAGLQNVFVYDTDAVPELTDYTNLTYFNADGLHLTNAGSVIAGNGFAEILKTL